MRREDEVSRLRGEANRAAYDMRELRADVTHVQEAYAARLEKLTEKARRIVERQRRIAERLTQLADQAEADRADHQ